MQDNYPLVSIIVPAFNRAKTLPATIISILNQTYKNIELIIVDDYSSDGTTDIVNSFIENDNRVHYYKLDKNRGACFARNYGFTKSKGEFIALMDSDDVCHLDRIQKQLNHAIDTNADFCFCGINRKENNNCSYYYPLRKIDFKKNVFEQELVENRICSVSMFMRRKVFETIKFDIGLRRYQDWDFGIRVCELFEVSFLDEALVDSTIQSDSITSKVSNYESLLAIYDKYKLKIESNKNVYSEFQIKLGDSLRTSDFKKSKQHFKNSLKTHFTLRTFIKYLLTSIHVKY